MFASTGSVYPCIRRAFAARADLLLVKLALRRQLAVCRRREARPRPRERDRLHLDSALATLAALAPCPGYRPAGHCCALASSCLATLLVIQEPTPFSWPRSDLGRAARTDSQHGQGKPALGHETDPRRTSRARLRSWNRDGSAVSTAGTATASLPDVADVPCQPRFADVGV
jgi:hypothetical protein